MMWFFAILIVLAMGGIAMVAAGRGTPMATAYDDRPDATVPQDGVLALVGWVVYLVGANDLVGIVALAFWWLTTFAGLLILLRWLPSRGKHATGARDDSWSEGPGLSVLAHVGTLVGVLVFTWFYVSR